MPVWVNHPAIQSGVAPFVVALVVAFLLRRVVRLAGAAAVVVALCVTVAWVTGFGLWPLTSTRKIVLVALAVAPVAVALEWASLRLEWRNILWFTVGAATIVWIAWPVLARRGVGEAVVTALPLVAYCGWVTAVAGHGPGDALGTASSVAALGLATGGAAIFGATALLGQLSLAVGAAAAGIVIVHLVFPEEGGARPLGVAAGLPVALLGSVATIYARLPTLALVPLALVPVAAFLRVPTELPRWGRAGILFALAMAPGAVAILYTYRIAGPVPL